MLDRRQALQARHREQILQAAAALIAERDGARFTVEELAARADVSRRTVFNHFGSSSGVVLALAEAAVSDRIGRLLSNPSAIVPEGPADRFRLVADALRASDLAPAVTEIERMLRGLDEARVAQLVQEAFARVAIALREQLVRLAPGTDELDADLMIASLIGGVNVIAQRWIALPGDRTTAAARREWDALLDTSIARARTGYAG